MKAKLKSLLIDKWEEDGTPCYYARFHQPVPPAKDKEPVSEFYLDSKDGKPSKYLVESIVYTPHGIIWNKNGEKDITPLANVVYARSSPSKTPCKNYHIEDENSKVQL